MLIPEGAPGFILFSILFVGLGIIYAIMNYVKLDQFAQGANEFLDYYASIIHGRVDRYFFCAVLSFPLLIAKSVFHNLFDVKNALIIVTDIIYALIFVFGIFVLFPVIAKAMLKYFRVSLRLERAARPPDDLFK